MAAGPGTILVQFGAQGRFLGLHLPWSSGLMPLAGLWTCLLVQLWNLAEQPSPLVVHAQIDLLSVNVLFCLPQICNSFVKRIVLKWTKLLLLGERSRHGLFVRKEGKQRLCFHSSSGEIQVLVLSSSIRFLWGSGNYLSHPAKWHSHMCGCA